MGMNGAELSKNSLAKKQDERIVKDLNKDPIILAGLDFDAATCVVSIDYLTKARDVLESLRAQMKPGGTVHLVISNRAFWDKVVRRWMEVDEEGRLMLVGDYLHFSGWKDIKIMTLAEATASEKGGSMLFGWGGRRDPVWVVRGTNRPV